MCPCSYCQRATGPVPGCPCEMCRRGFEAASINRNLAALMGYGLVGGDVRGYAPARAPANYGQRNGGCGCNGSR